MRTITLEELKKYVSNPLLLSFFERNNMHLCDLDMFNQIDHNYNYYISFLRDLNIIRREFNARGYVSHIWVHTDSIYSYEYDEKDRLIKCLDPLGGVSEFREYDEKGNLEKITHNDGRSITLLTYDGNNRLIKRDSSEMESFSYFYDSSGNVRKIVCEDDGAIILRQHDRKGNIVLELKSKDGVVSSSIQYVYTFDKNDALANIEMKVII